MSLSFWLAPVVGATRALSLAGCVVVMAFVAGCEVTDEAHLLSLSAVEPSELTLGDSLRIRGQGFPTGTDCRVGLRGVFAGGENDSFHFAQMNMDGRGWKRKIRGESTRTYGKSMER